MKVLRQALAALAAIVAAMASAGEGESSGITASPPEHPAWEFAITAYPTVVRGGDNYTSAIAAADRLAIGHGHGPLNHLPLGWRIP